MGLTQLVTYIEILQLQNMTFMSQITQLSAIYASDSIVIFFSCNSEADIVIGWGY